MVDSKEIRAVWMKELEEAQRSVDRLTGLIRDLDKAEKRISQGRESSQESGERDSNSLIARVAAALDDFAAGAIFDSPAVRARLRARHQETDYDEGNASFRATVTNALNALVERGLLSVVERGEGRRTTTYRRKPEGGAAVSV